MASQGERVLGVVGMCGSYLESMVQDTHEQDIIVQDIPIIVMQVELPPQINSEPEMGAAAAAEYGTTPSPPPSKSFPSPQRNRDRPRRFGFVGCG